MFIRIVKESLIRKRKRKIVAVVSVMLGAAIATAVLAIGLGIGDKVNRELRAYGANIQVLPRDRSIQVTSGGVQYQAAAAGSLLDEQDLPKLRTIFWANNILAFAPFLEVPVTARNSSASGPEFETNLAGTWFEKSVQGDTGDAIVTGVKHLAPWWKVDGRWPETGECLVGARLMEFLKARPGDDLSLQSVARGGFPVEARLKISGTLTTGSDEDRSIIADLETAQRLSGQQGKVGRIEISALTNPEDSLANKDPATLTPMENERRSCTPYPGAVAADIEKVIAGSEARPVRRISETEGSLLTRINLMLLLVAVAALAAAVLGVASTTMTTVLERKSEIGLLKAIGASDLGVTSIFLAESTITGICGGILGLAAGYGLAQVIARTVFGSSVPLSPILAPIIVAISLIVSFAGSSIPLRTALRLGPTDVLRDNC
jgi:putative ABC transport system permease protein